MAERTGLELKNSDYNYFILLGIPPYEEDVSVIRSAFQKKSNTWVKSKTALAKRYGELQKDIQHVMLEDEGARQAEAKNAVGFLLAKAVEAARIYCESGRIAKTTLEELARQYQVTREEKDTYDLIYQKLSGLFKPNGDVEFDTGAASGASPNDPQLQKYKDFENIEDYLATYSNAKGQALNDLYDAFGVSSSSTEQEISAAAKALMAKYKGKSDAAATAVGKLTASSTLRYVTEPDKRAEYQLFLGCSAVWRSLLLYKKQKIREMSAEVYLKYLNQILADTGSSQADADRELRLMCSYFGVSPEGGGKKQKLTVCPFCSTLFPGEASDATACPHCGTSFLYTCWNCNAHNSVLTGDVCRECGANSQMQTAFFQDIAAVKSLLNTAAPDLIKVRSMLQKATSYARKTDSKTEIGRSVASVEKLLQQAEKSIAANQQKRLKSEQEKNEIVALKDAQRLDSAMSRLLTLEKADPTYPVADLKRELQGLLAKAEQRISRAKSATGAARISEALEALRINCESGDAVNLLRGFRPAPVSGVQAVTEQTGVLLRWSASATANARYTIIRKVGSVPTSPEDGECVAKDLTVTLFSDSEAATAVPYYYAVFSAFSYQMGSQTEIVYSAPVCSGEVISFLPLTQVEAKVMADGLQIRWKRPAGVTEVAVWRGERSTPPDRAGEGTQIKTNDSGCLDRGLSQNGVYGYYLTCKYVINGKTYYSQPVKRAFQFYRLPDALRLVEWSLAERRNDYTQVKFQCGGVGRFRAYYGMQIPSGFEAGHYYTNEELKAFGLTAIPCEETAADHARLIVPVDTTCYLYPASAITEGAMLEKPVHYFLASEFTSIQATAVRENLVEIRLGWAGEATHCVIAVGTDACPKTVEAAKEQIRIGKKEFERDGKLLVTLKKQCNYLTLFAEFHVDGKTNYSQGVPISEAFDFREQMPIYYQTFFKPSVLKPFKVRFVFSCDSDCGALPEMAVVRSKWFDSGWHDKDCEELGSVQATLKKKLFGNTYTAECSFTSEPLRTEKAFYKLYFRDSATGMKLVPKLK